MTDQACDNDLWLFKEDKWSLLSISNAPAPRQLASMVYNDNESKMIVFGRKDNDKNRLDDVWSFKDKKWKQMKFGPSARSAHSMAYDASSEAIMMYGGYDGKSLGDLWQ